MKQLKIKITTTAPVILSETENSAILTGSLSFFSGTIIRGIFAARYIKFRRGNADVHNDTDFQELFFKKLRFLPAFIGINGKRSMLLPFSLMKNKNGGAVCDFLKDPENVSEKEDPRKKPGFKPFLSFGAVDNEGKVTPSQIKKSISLHMSRSDVQAKQSGKTAETGFERLAGKSSEGGIFNYEAVDAGQTFIAYILGEEDDLRRLITLTTDGEKTFSAYAGRSRAVQYGSCRVELEEIADFDAEIKPDQKASDTVYLRLDSPLIPYDELATDAEEVLTETILDRLKEATGNEFVINNEEMNLFAAPTTIENFVGVWGMRRPRVQALKAGTVFAVKKTNGGWNETDLKELSRIAGEGAGLRPEEGFGQLRGWTLRNSCELAGKKKENLPARKLSSAASVIAAKIMNARILDRLRAVAADDVQNVKGFKKEMTHAFARLDAILDADETVQGFHSRLKAVLAVEDDDKDKEKRTVFAKHLRNVKIAGKRLGDLLKGELAAVPGLNEKMLVIMQDLKFDDIKADLAPAEQKELISLSGDEAFAAYYHWFFRYARKKCTRMKGGQSK